MAARHSMDKLDAALDLTRRLPPSLLPQTLSQLSILVPDLTDDILASTDTQLGRQFPTSEYNIQSSSHRSPHTNTYVPAVSDPILPSDKLRQLEIEANDAFDTYRELYYGGGCSGVYLWDTDEGFAGCFCVTKESSGRWDSINVFEVLDKIYRLTTTVLLNLIENDLCICGSLTRQHQADGGNEGHLIVIGRMIEEMEGKMRNSLQQVYLGKTRDVAGDLRGDLEGLRAQKQLQGEVVKGLNKD